LPIRKGGIVALAGSNGRPAGDNFVANKKLRLQLDRLDDRCLPSVSPDQVNAALVLTNDATKEISGVIYHLNDLKTPTELSYIPGHLQDLANGTQLADSYLAEYLSELQAQVAQNPPNVSTLEAWEGTIASEEYQASIDAAYAEFYALAYGEPLPTSPPPPPSTDTGVNFGNGSSSLPFSLTDSSWQSIGNGVRISDVTVGTGTTLATGSQFTASYIGYLTDGTVFDSSAKDGSNLSGTVGQNLVAGFSAGLVGMKVGGERRIDIPADQGYGANPPSGSGIPANAELVFDVTLISSP
jgi:hypothetical protein